MAFWVRQHCKLNNGNVHMAGCICFYWSLFFFLWAGFKKIFLQAILGEYRGWVLGP
jgi:hypothetical protein